MSATMPAGGGFAGRVAFITGAAAGIGRTFARALAAEGAAVVVADIDGAGVEGTARTLRGEGAEALGIRCDVADEASVEGAVSQAVATFGGVDVLINNAARHLGKYDSPCTVLDRTSWREMLDVNVTGVLNCTAACVGTMRARGGGAVVNMASIGGREPRTAYGVSKVAVRGLTIALARELAVEGIRVNGIAPGIVGSEVVRAELDPARWDDYVQERQAIKRPGRMEDLVGAMLFLCSDAASFITGETITVSGGYPLVL